MSTPKVREYVERLRSPQRFVEIDRPCTLTDGIAALPDRVDLPADLSERLQWFIPASGAASRMFGPLLDLDPRTVQTRQRAYPSSAHRILSRWNDLALSDILPPMEGDLADWLRGLRSHEILSQPKALLPFHRCGHENTSPIRSHLLSTLQLIGHGPVHITWTAPPDSRDRMLAHIRQQVDVLGAADRVRFSVICQEPDTDLPAVELDGRPVRDGDRVLVRPGGHGALLRSLPVDADLIAFKNIDNAPHPDRVASNVPIQRQLVTALLDLEREHHDWIRAVRASASAAGDARAWLARSGLTGSTNPDEVLRDLHRPLRVCGMVPNQGQVGGGPFWAPSSDGRTTPQIVEASEIDRDDDGQRARMRASTHFNPVDIVASVRDVDGVPYDLSAFADPERWIITTKVHDGRPIRCLEHPGLWNGCMSGWITRFVALPPSSCALAKTLEDLLAPEHQAPPA